MAIGQSPEGCEIDPLAVGDEHRTLAIIFTGTWLRRLPVAPAVANLNPPPSGAN